MPQDEPEYGLQPMNGSELVYGANRWIPDDLLEDLRQEAKDRRVPTPEREKKQREGKGNQKFTYVDRLYIYAFLDEQFPNMWDFTITGPHVQLVDMIYVPVRITVRDPATGLTRRFDDFGCDEAIYNKDNELVSVMYLKNAVTDGLKRCAVHLGCANDLYQDDDDKKATDTDLLALYLKEGLSHAMAKEEKGELTYQQIFNHIYWAYAGQTKKINQLIKHLQS